MKYDNYIYIRAENKLEERRIKNQRELDFRIENAYSLDEAFRELNIERNMIGISIVKNVLNKGDVKSNVMKLKEKSLKIDSEINKLLIKYNLPSDYFDLKHYCNNCSDKGYVDNRICHCLKRLLLNCYVKNINKDISLENKTFDEFDFKYLDSLEENEINKMKKNYKICMDYSTNFTVNSKPIFMIGKSGKGKTHLTFSIANYLLDREYSVIIYKTFDLKNKFESIRFNVEEYNKLLDICKNCDLLILDDFSLDSVGEFFKDNIYNLISTRIDLKKPFILNTTDTTSKIFNKYGESFFNKLKNNAILLDFR